MFKKGFFICFLLFCSSVFGETMSNQNDIDSQQDMPTKEDELPIVKIESGFTETMTSHSIPRSHKEMLRLKWIGGAGITYSTAVFMPLVLEAQGSLMNQSEKLKWLFQAGGVLLSTFDWRRGVSAGVSSILQTGFKYNLSKELYGSFKGGAIHVLAVDRVWTGGLFFGSEQHALTLEGGIQVFYLGDEQWDLGVSLSIGSVIKKW